MNLKPIYQVDVEVTRTNGMVSIVHEQVRASDAGDAMQRVQEQLEFYDMSDNEFEVLGAHMLRTAEGDAV